MQSPQGKSKKSKGAKRPDGRPARARYWASDKLMTRKLRALVRSGATVAAAWAAWQARRRRPAKSQEYLPTRLEKALTRLAERVKARHGANLVRAMERWEARERRRDAQRRAAA